MNTLLAIDKGETRKKHSRAAFHKIFVVPADIMLADPQTGRRGREHVLFGIHEMTGLVAGLYLTNPDVDAARLVYCLRDCLLPKDALLKRLQLSGNWPVCGLFDAFSVPSDFAGTLEPAVRKLLSNYQIGLELRACGGPLPKLVEATVFNVSRRIAEAFCLTPSEIDDYPMEMPDIWKRLMSHALSYRPGRGFLEHITVPSEWNLYCELHPLQPVDDYLQDSIERDFRAVGNACYVCQTPGPRRQSNIYA